MAPRRSPGRSSFEWRVSKFRNACSPMCRANLCHTNWGPRNAPMLPRRPFLPNQPIAIVGLSALFPGSEDEAGFWRDIVAGKDLITDVPERRWLISDHYDPDPRAEDKTYCKRGAFLSPLSFDPMEFGIPPHALPATDTCQLLSLVAAKRVLDDVARGQTGEIDRDRTSVILGVTSGQQLFLE